VLQKPILKGTQCAARFSGDKKWYRAQVVQSLGKGLIEVIFIDYGNRDTINIEGDFSSNLRKLPPSLL